MKDKLKKYHGIIWSRDDDEQPGLRVAILAPDPAEAMRLAKEKYGQDTIITLVNEEEANRIR